MTERATNPVLRARLCDLCWFLDRKRSKIGLAAVSAYTEIAQKSFVGELKFSNRDGPVSLEPEVRDYLLRALTIGRVVGWEEPEVVGVRDQLNNFSKLAVMSKHLIPISWFFAVDLEFGVSEPAKIGSDLENILTELPVGSQNNSIVGGWRLAARAYHLAKANDDKSRCLKAAAEALVVEAEAKQGSAFLASHFLSGAIAQLHGVQGAKDRRAQLRHKLIDTQAGVTEEFSHFSQQIDIRELIEQAQRAVKGGCLLDKLFIFAALASSPDPKELIKSALESTQKYPLSSLFESSYVDRQGKVISRSQGGNFDGFGNEAAISKRIAQSESIRRRLVASGSIEPARVSIVQNYFISEDIFCSLLQNSPFVPSDLVQTFSRGFTCLFQGDFVCSTYILTPLLENSLRHVLKSLGYDVSNFDAATQTQSDKTISALFGQMQSELESIFSEAIIKDISRVFLDKPWPSLRHSIAHGLINDGDPFGPDAIYGCWLIFRLCMLPMFEYREELKASFIGTELCRE